MANFPTSLPTIPTSTTAETLGSMGGGTGHVAIENSQGDEIEAIAAKVGIAGSANTPAAGQVLKGIGSGQSQWGAVLPAVMGTFPSVRAHHNTTQTIGAGARAAISLNSERFDNDTMHDPGAATRLTFTTAGRYIVCGNVDVTPGASGGIVQVELRVGGSTFIATDDMPMQASTRMRCEVTTIWDFTAASYVELTVFNGTANTITIESTASISPELMAARLP